MPEHSDHLSAHLGAEHRQALEEIMTGCRITVISCLHWEVATPWKTPWRRCQDTFLLFPERGKIRAAVKGLIHTIRPGQFFMIPEDTRHALGHEPGIRRLRMFALHCHIHDRWSRPLAARFSQPAGRLPSRSWGLEALRELACLASSNSHAAQKRGSVFLRELLACQLAAGARFRPQPAAGDPRIGVVLDAIESTFSDAALSVEALARRVGITSVRLRELFRQETGQSPRKFLSCYRLRKAAQMLRRTPSSVKEIAAACGFTSDHYFHLAFRKHFACTPSGYRHAIRSQV